MNPLIIAGIFLILLAAFYIFNVSKKQSNQTTISIPISGLKSVCPPPVTDADYILPEDSHENCNIEGFYYSTKIAPLRSTFPTKRPAKYGGTDSCPSYVPPPTTKSFNCDPALDYCRGAWKDRNFTYFPRQDIAGNDIQCFFDSRNPDTCRDLCLGNTNCKGYNSVGGNYWSGCCYKTANGPLTKNNYIDFYSKNTSPITSGDDCYSKLSPKAVNLPRARYLKITKNNPNNPVLNLTEVQVFDENGIKINGTPTMSSTYLDFRATNCTDGNLTNFCHSNGQPNDWFQIDFGSDKFVSRIIIHNRQDCCQDRLLNSYVELINNANVTTWIRQIFYTYGIYYFNLVQDSKLSANPGGWANVKNRKPGESDIDWAQRIYDAIVNDPIGIRPFGRAVEPGISALINNAKLAGKSSLDLTSANAACLNPMTWYYNAQTLQQQRTKVLGAAMCNTSLQAINFV
jgi:hypothetical protein